MFDSDRLRHVPMLIIQGNQGVPWCRKPGGPHRSSLHRCLHAGTQADRMVGLQRPWRHGGAVPLFRWKKRCQLRQWLATSFRSWSTFSLHSFPTVAPFGPGPGGPVGGQNQLHPSSFDLRCHQPSSAGRKTVGFYFVFILGLASRRWFHRVHRGHATPLGRELDGIAVAWGGSHDFSWFLQRFFLAVQVGIARTGALALSISKMSCWTMTWPWTTGIGSWCQRLLGAARMCFRRTSRHSWSCLFVACDAVSISKSKIARFMGSRWFKFKDLKGVINSLMFRAVFAEALLLRWIRAAVAHTVSRLWRILLHGRWRSLNGS